MTATPTPAPALASPGPPLRVDQGLRAYMLGVYNYMTLGLGLTGVVAYFAYLLADVHFGGGRISALTDFGQAIYFSPLRWVVIFAPLALVFCDLGRPQRDVGRGDARFSSPSRR